MSYQASITAKNKGKFYDCFLPEIYKDKRAEFNVKKNKKDLKFNIKAKDAVALRATTNSIIKLFNILEKIKTIK